MRARSIMRRKPCPSYRKDREINSDPVALRLTKIVRRQCVAVGLVQDSTLPLWSLLPQIHMLDIFNRMPQEARAQAAELLH
jgi:hypothetical protein